MTHQTKESIRIELFMNAAKDLAEVIGTEMEEVTLKVKLDDYGRLRQAEKLHEKLQDYMDFRVQEEESNETLCVYRKDNLTITFEFQEA